MNQKIEAKPYVEKGGFKISVKSLFFLSSLIKDISVRASCGPYKSRLTSPFG